MELIVGGCLLRSQWNHYYFRVLRCTLFCTQTNVVRSQRVGGRRARDNVSESIALNDKNGILAVAYLARNRATIIVLCCAQFRWCVRPRLARLQGRYSRHCPLLDSVFLFPADIYALRVERAQHSNAKSSNQ